MYNNRTQRVGRVSEWERDETKKTKKEKNIKRWGKTLMIHLFVCIYTYVLHFIIVLTKKWVKKENFIQVNCSASKNKHVNIHMRADRYEIIFFWIWVACYVYLSNLICGWIFIVHYFIFFSPYFMYFSNWGSRYGFWFCNYHFFWFSYTRISLYAYFLIYDLLFPSLS